MTAVLDRLRGISGLHLRPGDEGPAIHGVLPSAVAEPETPEAAAEALRLASAERWIVEVGHGGAPLRLAGRPPERIDLLLSSARLDDVADYAPADLTASVGAGATLSALAERFGEHGQWLPLDPPGSAATTIGATVDAAAAGPLRLGFGTPRDHVLGLEVVTGDGRGLRFGGRVVKNVAGYDVVKLLVGARGTLGMLTRVNLRLRPRPEAERTLALSLGAAGAAVDAARVIRERRIEPAALELVSPYPRSPAGERPWALLCRLLGAASAIEAQAVALEEVAREMGARVEEPAGSWSAMGHVEADALVAIRLAAGPSDLGATLDLVEAAFPHLERAGGRWAAHAHAGSGIVRLLGTFADVRGEAGSAHRGLTAAAASELMPDWAPLAGFVRSAREGLAPVRGTVVVAAAPAGLIAAVDPYGPIPGHDIMRRLKSLFDPAGILAPGRFAV